MAEDKSDPIQVNPTPDYSLKCAECGEFLPKERDKRYNVNLVIFSGDGQQMKMRHKIGDLCRNCAVELAGIMADERKWQSAKSRIRQGLKGKGVLEQEQIIKQAKEDMGKTTDDLLDEMEE